MAKTAMSAVEEGDGRADYPVGGWAGLAVTCYDSSVVFEDAR